MKFAQGLAIAGAVAGALGVTSVADAASLAVGKKLELKVNPKKMSEERTRLWAKFGGWCAIKDWHPAIASCEESTEGDAKIRVLTLKDGGKIKEKASRREAKLLPLRNSRKPAARQKLSGPVCADTRR